MNNAKKFGWFLIISGMLVIMLPFISGFTGFFFTSYATKLPISYEAYHSQYLIVGFVLLASGLLIANPTKKRVY